MSFLACKLRLYKNFEPPSYSATGKNVCVVVDGGGWVMGACVSILLCSKPDLWPYTLTGTIGQYFVISNLEELNGFI